MYCVCVFVMYIILKHTKLKAQRSIKNQTQNTLKHLHFWAGNGGDAGGRNPGSEFRFISNWIGLFGN